MQERLVAIAMLSILLAVGLLARRHEAEAAHATEHSGRVIHAEQAADHHELDNTAHLHGREVHEHTGDCTLLAMLHERIVHTAAVTAAGARAVAKIERSAQRGVHVARASYRLAPKTSPPRA